MNYRKALENLQRLLTLIERQYRSEQLSEEEQAQVSMLYGACEPVISQIVGVQQVRVPSYGSLVETYPNFIEAGYLSGRSIHHHEGLQQLRKVVGRVRQLAEDPAVPQPAASISQLLQVLNRGAFKGSGVFFCLVSCKALSNKARLREPKITAQGCTDT